MASPTAAHNVLDPLYPAPLKSGLRYTLARKTLGRMEHLARAQSELQTANCKH